MRKAIIISLRFNPGHFSHLVATYRLMAMQGMEPILYLHPSFRCMDRGRQFETVYLGDGLHSIGPIRLAVFWFPSVRNLSLILRLKYAMKTRTIYVFHEPLESVKRYLTAGFSLLHTARIIGVNLVSIAISAFSDRVLLPSRKACEIYALRYRWINSKFAYAPLMFDDEATVVQLSGQKRTISYIGTVAPDHAFDQYVAFIEAAIRGGWLQGYEFDIATRSIIPEALMKRLKSLLVSGRLRLTQGTPLTTEEINEHFAQSLVVWNAYNRSMQSGILPKAYMFGAAVLVAEANDSEFVQHGVTGMVLRSNADVDEILGAIETIKARSESFRRACRLAFETTFYFENAKASAAFTSFPSEK